MASRSKVLRIFKQLHRTRQKVFEGDTVALNAAREKINSEFKNNKDENDPQKIDKLITIGIDSEVLLRKTVVQAVLKDDNKYEVKLTPDTAFEKNTMFDPHAKLPPPRSRKKCSDNPT